MLFIKCINIYLIYFTMPKKSLKVFGIQLLHIHLKCFFQHPFSLSAQYLYPKMKTPQGGLTGTPDSPCR